MKPRILLACGTNWHAPARLPRLFHQAGCHVSVFSAPDWALRSTRFIDEAIDAPNELVTYVDALRLHLESRKGQYAWVVVLDDPLLAEVVASTNRDWVSGWFPIHPHSKFLPLCAEKSALTRFAAQLGVPTPRSIVCENEQDVLGAADAIGYPVMIKQSSSYAGIGVRSANDRAEVEAAYRALAREGKELVVQAFVEGRLGNTAVLFQRGVPITWMSAFKSRTWPGAFGPSAARQFTSHDAIRPLLESFGKATGYHGFGAFDWVLTSQDQLQVIEFNARPVPALHMGRSAGVDFAQAMAALLKEETYVRPPAQLPKDSPIFSMFPEDFYRAITEGDEASLSHFLPGGLGHEDIPWDDPPLLQFFLKRRAMRRNFDKLFPDAGSMSR